MENFILENGLLTLQEGTVILQAETFAERADICRVVLPSSLEILGAAAFAACENLQEVRGGENLRQIGDGAFTLCHRLRSFPFSDSLRSIGEMAFWETALTRVTLPAHLEELGDSAFWACGELTHLDLLSPDCRIGVDTLGDCKKLISGYIAPGFPAGSYYNQADELNFTLLWLSCPERHSGAVSERADKFVRDQLSVIMECIFERNAVPMLEGLLSRGLLSRQEAAAYLPLATARQLPELSGLLLEVSRPGADTDYFEELEL